MRPFKVKKETKPILTFQESIILKAQSRLLQLRYKLFRVMLIGSGEGNKSSIIFKDMEGIKNVKTTIWSFDFKFVNLKDVINLSMNNIKDVIHLEMIRDH